MSWNGFPAFNMGTGPLGTFTMNGSNYTVNYQATVPLDDPTGFGGVPYSLHLEGRIFAPALVPEPGSLLLLGTGMAGLFGILRRKK